MKLRNEKIREKIMKNAARLFLKKGFFNTTVEEIALSSKISKGAVYIYFNDKESIYLEIIDNFFLQAIKYLDVLKGTNLTALEKLKKIVKDWNEVLMKNRFIFPIVSIENVNLSQKIFRLMKKRIEERIMQIFSGIEEIIKEGIENNEIKDINTRFAAFYFMEVIRIPVLLSCIYKNEKVNPEEMIELFLNGIKKGR